MSHFLLTQVIRLIAISVAMAPFVATMFPSAQCLAQDSEVVTDVDDFEIDFSDETDEFEEDFSVEYNVAYDSNDFKDLPPAVQTAIIIIGTLVALAIVSLFLFVLYLLYSLLKAVPPHYRVMEPGLVWLLLIPCFNLIWNFFVFSRIARSYQNVFYANGRHDVGDCGAGIGVAYSICAVLISIPCLNYVTIWFCGPAMLVLAIIYLVRLHALKSELKSGKLVLDEPEYDPYLM